MDISKEFDLFEEFTPELMPGKGSYDSPYLFYNNALEKLRQGSDDMAIILLKKAVTSSEFVPNAYILLALCLYKNKEEDEAREVLKAVLCKDPGNSLAKHYMSNLFEVQSKKRSKTKFRPGKKTTVSNAEISRIPTPEKDKPKRMKPDTVHKKVENNQNTENITKDISAKIQENIARHERKAVRGNASKNEYATPALVILLICLAAGGVLGYLIGSKRSNANLNEAQNSLLQYQSQIQDYQKKESQWDNTLQKHQITVNQLKNEKEELQEKLRLLEEEIQSGQVKLLLGDVRNLLDVQDYTAATEALKEFQTDKLNEENTQIYTTLYDQAYKGLCTQLFEQGMVNYENRRYEDAYDMFTRAIHTGYEFEISVDLQYRAGRCVYETGDYETAIGYFDVIGKQYPDYRYADYAIYYMGRAYQYQEKYEKAKEAYIIARDNYPQSSLRDSIFARINEVNSLLG